MFSNGSVAKLTASSGHIAPGHVGHCANSECGGGGGHKQEDEEEEEDALISDTAKNGPTVSVLHFDAYFEEMSAQDWAGFRRQFKVGSKIISL